MFGLGWRRKSRRVPLDLPDPKNEHERVRKEFLSKAPRLFEAGCLYQVDRAVPSRFLVGEFVRFIAPSGYSPYDGAWVYLFETEAGAEKNFFLGDRDSRAAAKGAFRIVSDKGR